ADVAQIQVIDRGVGIASADLVRIFEPFYQVDSTRNGVSGNVGLGLSICKKLVELHGGAIAASSLGPQLGTVFVVSLPARDGS
ncbi:ATP-binding protein, partial [Staphylococcus aureus]|uniref:sensor histidine kinase n=1 Tax=Staphylococcus aureus TaxID=1280 RepID=UPI001E5E7D36